MSLEAATKISELDPNNPPGTDKKKQGDDHIRMLKAVLKFCFPNASKPFYFPDSGPKTANFNVLSTEQNKTFICDTTAGSFIATLPVLTTDDAGWECFFIKTTLNNLALFVASAGGLLSGEFTVSKARRCIPNIKFSAYWTGSVWVVGRTNSYIVGSVVDLGRRTIAPWGYVFAAGQDVGLAADFPELYLAQTNSTVVTDRRGRGAFGRDNMSGVAANRISGASGGLTPGAAIGAEALAITQGNLPAYNLTVIDGGHGHAVNDGGHVHGGERRSNAVQGTPFGADYPALRDQVSGNTDAALTGVSIQGSFTGIVVQSGGSNTPYNKLPPGIITDLYVVLE